MPEQSTPLRLVSPTDFQARALDLLADTELLRGLLHRHGSDRILRWLRYLCVQDGRPYGPEGERA